MTSVPDDRPATSGDGATDLPAILVLDDDPNILAAARRTLREAGRLVFAGSLAEGRTAIAGTPCAVALVDRHLGDGDGITFLRELRQSHPDTVRVLFTGDDTQQAAIQAVNEGAVFRFLLKPCPTDTLRTVVAAALRQHQLQTAERELPTRTLLGALRLLSEVLSLMDPEAFGRALLLRERLREALEQLGEPPSWETEVAAMLMPLSSLALTPEARQRQSASPSEGVNPGQLRVAESIAQIPRMAGVAQLIAGNGAVAVPSRSACVLTLLDQHLRHERPGLSSDQVWDRVQTRIPPTWLPVLAALRSAPTSRPRSWKRHLVLVRELRAGMVLRTPLTTVDGRLLIASGQIISEAVLERLMLALRTTKIVEPILVESHQTPTPPTAL